MASCLPTNTDDIKPEDLPRVSRLPASTPLVDIIKTLTVSGGVIVEGLYSLEMMKQLESEIRPFLQQDLSWDGSFFPQKPSDVSWSLVIPELQQTVFLETNYFGILAGHF